jgi:DNA modification methylase
VLDAFGGSGTTLIAAEKAGRKARLLELDPAYCDVTCRRFEAYTGKSAILAESDLPWAEVAELRAETAPAEAI